MKGAKTKKNIVIHFKDALILENILSISKFIKDLSHTIVIRFIPDILSFSNDENEKKNASYNLNIVAMETPSRIEIVNKRLFGIKIEITNFIRHLEYVLKFGSQVSIEIDEDKERIVIKGKDSHNSTAKLAFDICREKFQTLKSPEDLYHISMSSRNYNALKVQSRSMQDATLFLNSTKLLFYPSQEDSDKKTNNTTMLMNDGTKLNQEAYEKLLLKLLDPTFHPRYNDYCLQFDLSSSFFNFFKTNQSRSKHCINIEEDQVYFLLKEATTKDLTKITMFKYKKQGKIISEELFFTSNQLITCSDSVKIFVHHPLLNFEFEKKENTCESKLDISSIILHSSQNVLLFSKEEEVKKVVPNRNNNVSRVSNQSNKNKVSYLSDMILEEDINKTLDCGKMVKLEEIRDSMEERRSCILDIDSSLNNTIFPEYGQGVKMEPIFSNKIPQATLSLNFDQEVFSGGNVNHKPSNFNALSHLSGIRGEQSSPLTIDNLFSNNTNLKPQTIEKPVKQELINPFAKINKTENKPENKSGLGPNPFADNNTEQKKEKDLKKGPKISSDAFIKKG
jgi:hypothetical protein